jgi:hypothetical protein
VGGGVETLPSFLSQRRTRFESWSGFESFIGRRRLFFGSGPAGILLVLRTQRRARGVFQVVLQRQNVPRGRPPCFRVGSDSRGVGAVTPGGGDGGGDVRGDAIADE